MGSGISHFELDGHDEYRIGDIFNGIDIEKREIWSKTCFVDSRKDCGDCWARYLCGGGCRTHSIQFNGDLLQPVEIECELKKLQFEMGVWLVSKFQEELHGSANIEFLTKKS